MISERAVVIGIRKVGIIERNGIFYTAGEFFIDEGDRSERRAIPLNNPEYLKNWTYLPMLTRHGTTEGISGEKIYEMFLPLLRERGYSK